MLIICSECKHQASSRAASCPTCGAPIRDSARLARSERARAEWGIILAALLFVLIGCILF